MRDPRPLEIFQGFFGYFAPLTEKERLQYRAVFRRRVLCNEISYQRSELFETNPGDIAVFLSYQEYFFRCVDEPPCLNTVSEKISFIVKAARILEIVRFLEACFRADDVAVFELFFEIVYGKEYCSVHRDYVVRFYESCC